MHFRFDTDNIPYAHLHIDPDFRHLSSCFVGSSQPDSHGDCRSDDSRPIQDYHRSSLTDCVGNVLAVVPDNSPESVK